MMGKDGPYTSASKIPTLAPIIVRAYAKFTETELFPTPPLQLETATMCLTPLRPGGMPRDSSSDKLSEDISTDTSSTQGRLFRLSCTSVLNTSFTGQAGVVNCSRIS